MYMMFVDESGDPGYPRNGKWDKWGGSSHFVRVGVIIHGWKWRAWNERLIFFKRNRGLSWDDEIRASDIRRGKGCFAGWMRERRGFFLSNLLDLIAGSIDLTLLGVVIDKRKVDVTQRDRLVKPEVRSLELLLERFNGFLNEQWDKAGIVVLDPTKEKSDDNLRYFQSFLQTFSGNLKPPRIVESAFFAKSHTSNMIQISDICTNVLYRSTTGKGDSSEKKALWSRFWRKGKRLKGIGLKEWP